MAPGVVIEMEDQQDTFLPYYHCPGVWGDYLLQTAYPCRRRRIVLAASRPFDLKFELHNGAPPPVEHECGDYHVCTWDQRDVSGVEWDQLTPPLNEFAAWVDFSTVPGWKPIAKYYFTELKLPVYHDLKNLVSQALSGNSRSTEEKIAAAYNYAARDVRYGRPKVDPANSAIRPLGDTANELRGDCKDKSALLVALLGEMGIRANVVLVRSGQGWAGGHSSGHSFQPRDRRT